MNNNSLQQQQINYNKISKTTGNVLFKSPRKPRKTSNFSVVDNFVIRMMVKFIYPILEEKNMGQYYNIFGLNTIQNISEDASITSMFQETGFQSLTQRDFSSAITHIKPIVQRYDLHSNLRATATPSSQWTKAYAPMFYTWMISRMIDTNRSIFDQPNIEDFKAIIDHSYEHGYTTFRSDVNGMVYVKSKYYLTILTESEVDNIKTFIKTCEFSKCLSSPVRMVKLGQLRTASAPDDKLYYFAFVGEFFNKMVNQKKIRDTITADNFFHCFDNALMEYLTNSCGDDNHTTQFLPVKIVNEIKNTEYNFVYDEVTEELETSQKRKYCDEEYSDSSKVAKLNDFELSLLEVLF